MGHIAYDSLALKTAILALLLLFVAMLTLAAAAVAVALSWRAETGAPAPLVGLADLAERGARPAATAPRWRASPWVRCAAPSPARWPRPSIPWDHLTASRRRRCLRRRSPAWLSRAVASLDAVKA